MSSASPVIASTAALGAAPANTAAASAGRVSTAPVGTGPAGAAGAGDGSSGPASGGLAGNWRRWATPVGIVLIILLGGALIAALQPSASPAGYLDPGSPGQSGARALADILARRGEPVIRAGTVEAAEAAAHGGDVTLVITSPGLLSARQLDSLAATDDSLIVVGPVGASLTALAPGVAVAGEAPLGGADPSCGLPAARLAGNAEMGGVLLGTTAHGMQQCYPVDGHPTLIRYATGRPTTGRPTTGRPTTGRPAGRRTITLLGSGAPLTNQDLAARGDAALALDLLSGNSRIVWLVPTLPLAGAPPSGGPQSLFSLIPWPAYLVTIQLAIAVGLAALWRMRRLGPLVTEPLPVVVRASETVEGHGRLYRSRRSRDRAAAVLREAALDRITTRLALPKLVPPTLVPPTLVPPTLVPPTLAPPTPARSKPGRPTPADPGGPGPRTNADLACAAIAARTGHDAAGIRATLFGPVPRDDAALVALARDIDTLEGEVRTR
jgi:hypothetical protein